MEKAEDTGCKDKAGKDFFYCLVSAFNNLFIFFKKMLSQNSRKPVPKEIAGIGHKTKSNSRLDNFDFLNCIKKLFGCWPIRFLPT